jgi:hypothetical protein
MGSGDFSGGSFIRVIFFSRGIFGYAHVSSLLLEQPFQTGVPGFNITGDEVSSWTLHRAGIWGR